MKNIILCFSLFFSISAYSQNYSVEWQKTYGGSDNDSGARGTQTSDGGCIVVGSSRSSDGDVTSNNLGWDDDIWIVKLNDNGAIIWEKSYGGSGSDMACEVQQTSDEGYIVAGYTNSNDGDITINQGSSDYWILKLDSLGNLLWQKTFGGSGNDYLGSVQKTIDDGFVLCGQSNSTNGDISNNHGSFDYWIVKIDSSGNVLWQKTYGGTGNDWSPTICLIDDGSFAIAGHSDSNDGDVIGNHGNSDYWVLKIDSTGNIIWKKCFGGTGNEWSPIISTASGNGFIISGSTQSTNGDITSNNGGMDCWVVKIDYSGNLNWQKSLGGTGNESPASISQVGDGAYVLTANTRSNNGDVFGNQDLYSPWVVKLDPTGNILWQMCYEHDGYQNLSGSFRTNDGGFLLTGWTEFVLGNSQSREYWVSKIAMTNSNGKVYLDLNGNCNLDSGETMISGFNVIVQPSNQISISDTNGIWEVNSLQYGNYTATIDTTNNNWTSTCPIAQVFTITDPSIFTQGPNFGLISTSPCTEPDVSIYAPTLRPCLPNQMIDVNVCNQITATGVLNDSYIDVELDPLITINGSSMPFTNQGNNTYRFQTGTLYPGQCVNINISTTISSSTIGCADLLGLTLCVRANLYPVESCVLDTIPSNPPSGGGGTGILNGLPQPCTLPWDQSSLSVDGWCANDSIYFTITNTGVSGGGDMECYSPMWITVDGVVTYTDSIMIPGGETVTLVYPGDGQTWILNAEQHPLHPGNSHPNAHVEACGDTTNWTPDGVNDFPLDDADPVVDIYCGLVTGSYDPNDKTGYPNGVTDQNYIQPNQQLQYVIRFQNTGTDTAFTVVIRDTLDTDLNIFTVTPGVSSHNYEFRMYGPRVLEWTFNNILLPDSTTNEPESNGFVTFHLEQVPDLAPGTEITNDADIYFDFNDPITTNTTMHRIYEGFVAVAHLEEMSKETSGLSVYPNPSNGQFTLLLDKVGPENYSLYDQQGRVVKVGSLTGKKTTIALELNNGMYYLKVGKNVTKVQVAR